MNQKIKELRGWRIKLSLGSTSASCAFPNEMDAYVIIVISLATARGLNQFGFNPDSVPESVKYIVISGYNFNFLMAIPTQDGAHQKVANRLTARVIPIILVGIVGYVSYVVIALVCGQFQEKRREQIWEHHADLMR